MRPQEQAVCPNTRKNRRWNVVISLPGILIEQLPLFRVLNDQKDLAPKQGIFVIPLIIVVLRLTVLKQKLVIWSVLLATPLWTNRLLRRRLRSTTTTIRGEEHYDGLVDLKLAALQQFRRTPRANVLAASLVIVFHQVVDVELDHGLVVGVEGGDLAGGLLVAQRRLDGLLVAHPR